MSTSQTRTNFITVLLAFFFGSKQIGVFGNEAFQACFEASLSFTYIELPLLNMQQGSVSIITVKLECGRK